MIGAAEGLKDFYLDALEILADRVVEFMGKESRKR